MSDDKEQKEGGDIGVAILGFEGNGKSAHNPQAVTAISQAYEDGIIDALKKNYHDDYAWDLGKPFGCDEEARAYELGYCLGRELRYCR